MVVVDRVLVLVCVFVFLVLALSASIQLRYFCDAATVSLQQQTEIVYVAC